MEKEVTNKTIKIARTRSGVPCLWESLMNFADLKRSTVILDEKGNSKVAVFLNEEREKQALVPVVVGDYISKSFADKNGVAISLFKIVDISSMKNEAVIVPVYRKSSLVNEEEYPGEYYHMILTTLAKLDGKIKVVSKPREKEYAE
jgi:hypothetical protein